MMSQNGTNLSCVHMADLSFLCFNYDPVCFTGTDNPSLESIDIYSVLNCLTKLKACERQYGGQWKEPLIGKGDTLPD